MERITYRITLDAHKNGIQRTLQGFETADNMARRIAVNLVANGDTYEIPSGNVVALMYVTTPDATEPSINECTIDGNTIVYDVLPITKEGITEMQLKLIETSVSGAKSVIMSPRFAVEVLESGAKDDDAEQTATFTALENAVARANGVYEGRLIRIVIDDDCTFRALYADGTMYENDALKDAMHGGNAILAESWAVGGTGTREGENTNNSKYYSDVSKSAASEANKAEDDIRELVDEAQMYSTFTVFDVDYETGELKYLSRNYGFDIDEGTGELMVDGGDAYSPNEIVAEEVNKRIECVVNYVTPEMYGAVGDGKTNDYAALNKCLNSGYNVVFKAKKTYYFEGLLNIKVDNVTICGNGAKLLSKCVTTSSSVGNNSVFQLENCSNVTIYNLEVNGQSNWVERPVRYGTKDVTEQFNLWEKTRQNSYDVFVLKTSNHINVIDCISSYGKTGYRTELCSDIVFRGCYAHHTLADGFFNGSTSKILISNCKAEYTGDDCFSCCGYQDGVYGCTIENCYASNCVGALVCMEGISDGYANNCYGYNLSLRPYKLGCLYYATNGTYIIGHDIIIENCRVESSELVEVADNSILTLVTSDGSGDLTTYNLTLRKCIYANNDKSGKRIRLQATNYRNLTLDNFETNDIYFVLSGQNTRLNNVKTNAGRATVIQNDDGPTVTECNITNDNTMGTNFTSCIHFINCSNIHVNGGHYFSTDSNLLNITSDTAKEGIFVNIGTPNIYFNNKYTDVMILPMYFRTSNIYETSYFRKGQLYYDTATSALIVVD